MDRLRWIIKKSNWLFSSILLILFYLFIIPLGKVLYYVVLLFKKRNKNTYWNNPETQTVDLNSPY